MADHHIDIKFSSQSYDYLVDKYPSKCPYCKHYIRVTRIEGKSTTTDERQLYLSFMCPNCEQVFITLYNIESYLNQDCTGYSGKAKALYKYKREMFPDYSTKEFDKIILDNFKDFVNIYNQSYKAEQAKLNDVAGSGYRKALEYFIKDFCIEILQIDKSQIENKFLGNVIKEHITDQRIIDMAEKAAWLGNDQTHYDVKWADKDINDLKRILDVIIYFVEIELYYKQYQAEMKK